jgi:hypothetical protein
VCAPALAEPECSASQRDIVNMGLPFGTLALMGRL